MTSGSMPGLPRPLRRNKFINMRVVASIIIILASVTVTPALLFPLVVLHALSWFALELIVIGAFIDAYFGATYGFPFYTLGAAVVVFLSELIKPHLSFYDGE